MDDIAIVTNKKEDLCKILERVQQLSDILGLKTNRAKTEIYLWGQKAPEAAEKLEWLGDEIWIRPPVFRYLGHTLAHPEWTTEAQQLFPDGVHADLTRYEDLPLNAWERVELINSVLMPRWSYKVMLIPHDAIFRQVDKMCKEWVTKCKGMETVRHTSKLSTPIKEGGMGLYQLFWSFRMRYVTVVQLKFYLNFPKTQ